MTEHDQDLHLQAHKQCLRELKKRVALRPKPTKEELFLGAYVEMIEPQVRNAVRVLNHKGYTTCSSGFYGKKQAIDGFFEIDNETKNILGKSKVRVNEKNGYTSIAFIPKKQSLRSMQQQWDAIASILPRKKAGHQSDTAGSTLFRENPLRESFYAIGELEYHIARKERNIR